MDDSPDITPRQAARRGWFWITATLIAFGMVVWIFQVWNLDRRVSGAFYSMENGWFLADKEPWQWLYRFGPLPGIVLAVSALLGYAGSRLRRSASDWHKYFLLVVLTAAFGAGLLANGIFKPYWGRPRPSQTLAFGGQYAYRPVWLPGIPGKGKSFPSGHATMGFVFTSLFLFRRKSKLLAYTGGSFGLAYGGLLSAARVVQGAHFPTDCIGSLAVMWMTAVFLYYWVLKIPCRPAPPRYLRHPLLKPLVPAAYVLVVAVVLFLLVRRPFYETYYGYWGKIPPNTHHIYASLAGGFDQSRIRYSDRTRGLVLVHVKGYAWPGASQKLKTERKEKKDGTLRVRFRLKPTGRFSHLSREIEVVIPRPLKDRITVSFTD